MCVFFFSCLHTLTKIPLNAFSTQSCDSWVFGNYHSSSSRCVTGLIVVAAVLSGMDSREPDQGKATPCACWELGWQAFAKASVVNRNGCQVTWPS